MGIKVHSERPWVMQQMLARIVLVAVPTVSWWEWPGQTILNLYTCIGEKGETVGKRRFCHRLWSMVVGNLSLIHLYVYLRS